MCTELEYKNKLEDRAIKLPIINQICWILQSEVSELIHVLKTT